MSKKHINQRTFIYALEQTHSDALFAARRAIRSGDLPAAERWMRIVALMHRTEAQHDAFLERRRARNGSRPRPTAV